jgi:hypothetical protein
MKNIYDIGKIDSLLERVLAEIGPDCFSHLKLLELERLVRTYDPERKLPGKTVLRAAINRFRKSRWPESAPKHGTGRSRYF